MTMMPSNAARSRAVVGSNLHSRHAGGGPVVGVLDATPDWVLRYDRRCEIVEVDEINPSRLYAKKREWLITSRGKVGRPTARIDRRNPAQVQAQRAARGWQGDQALDVPTTEAELVSIHRAA
jgi:hypothetical protein